jgi:asparagine synthase (glutamine-hydrolysing)
VTAVTANQMALAAGKPVVVSFAASPETFVGGEAPVDGPAVLAMSERFGLEIHHADTDRVSFRDALLMAAPGMMPPSYKTSPVHHWAAGIGVGTVLTGWGGDEAASFNGRSHLAELLRRGRVLQLGGRVLHMSRPHQTLWHRAVVPNLPDGVLSRIARRRARAGLRRLAASTADDALAYELGVVERLRRPLRTQPTTLRTQLALLGDGHLVDRIEEWSADATRYGIDYCHPLLDRRVVELALAAPNEAFVHGGFNRWLFRRAMDPYLPKEVAWRRGKDDSWVQQRRIAGWSTVDPETRAGWSMARAREMVAEGNDLGGTVDLAKLQRRIAEVPEGGYGPGTPITARAPMLMINRATSLAAFLERNRVAVG